jgi:TrmH family RNA methyltransferase
MHRHRLAPCAERRIRLSSPQTARNVRRGTPAVFVAAEASRLPATGCHSGWVPTTEHSRRDEPDPVVTSPANPQVKALVALRKRRDRDQRRVTIVDGYDELVLALDAGAEVETVYYCPEIVTDPTRLGLLERLTDMDTPVVRMGHAAFARASYRESPDGWLGVVARPGRAPWELELPPSALVLVAERVEKPGNLGAMLRTAEAAGVAALVAADPVTDWGNPNVIRASKGTVFAVPVAAGDTADVLAWVRQVGLRIVVATPDATTLLGEVDLTGPTAVVVGAEHLGVGSAWRTAADDLVRIPMAGRVNSLNVATSAALVVFDAVRQRRN